MANATDEMYLKELQKKMGTSVVIDGNTDFRETLYEMSTQTKYLSELNILNITLKLRDIRKALPDKEKCKLYRCGYIRKERKRVLVGLIIWIDSKNGLKAKDNQKWKKVKFQIGSYTAFVISSDRLKIFGNKRVFLSAIRRTLKNCILTPERATYDNSSGQILDKLLTIQKSQAEIEIYEVQFETGDTGKKTRMRAYADSGDLVEKFISKNLPQQNKMIRNFLDIKFKDKQNRRAILKITTVENHQILRWKPPYNELTSKISSAIGIAESECLISSARTSSEKIDEFFREDYISDIKRNVCYAGMLQEYSEYLFIDKNRHTPQIKIKNVISTMKNILGGEIEGLDLVKKGKVFFPVETLVKDDFSQGMARIKKDGKIVQHILLDHELPYKQGERDLVYRFLPFVPFYVLDFRKTPKDEKKVLPKDNSLLISSGEFISNLKNNPDKIKERILEKTKSVISPEERSFHFEAACKALGKLAGINRELKSESQMKGSLFEGMVFCILIELFPTKKMGGSRLADGKFLFDDDKVLYDAKNLRLGKRSLWNSVKKEGLPKDIDYILSEGVSEYVFIMNRIDSGDFSFVKKKIEEGVKARGKECRVSCITAKGIRDIVSISKKAGISVNRNMLKKKILSGQVTRKVKEEEITGNLD